MKKNDKLFLICLTLGIFVIIAGGGLIYDIINPPQPISPITINQVLGLGFLCICASTLIHGFHPILLVKSNSNSKTINE